MLGTRTVAFHPRTQGDVFLLIGFIIAIYGILGVQLFPGALHYRCYEARGYDDTSKPIDPVRGVCTP